MMSDGSFIYAGAAKGIMQQSFKYRALFVQRENIKTNGNTCMKLSVVPNARAISYNEDQS